MQDFEEGNSFFHYLSLKSFRPIFGTAAAAAAAIAASQASATSTTASSHLSDSIIGGGLGSGNKVTSSAFQPPNPNNQKGGPTSPPGISSTGPGGTLFSPGQNLYPHRGCAGRVRIHINKNVQISLDLFK